MTSFPHPLINVIAQALHEAAQYEISPDLLALLTDDCLLLAALQRLALCWHSRHVQPEEDTPRIVEADAWIIK